MNSKDLKEFFMKDKVEAVKPIFLSTGCTLLDLVVGGGVGMGFPVGVIVNIAADKSAGKSLLATEMVAAGHHKHKNKLLWNYDDAETGHTFNTNNLYGFGIFHPETFTSRTVEELDTNVGMFLNKLKPEQLGIYVLDSLDGLSDKDKEERSEKRVKDAEEGKTTKEKGSYGMTSAKFLSQEFFKTKTSQFDGKNALLVIISQVRENIDPFSFKKFDRSGGKAMDFYAHTCLWLANVGKIKKSDKTIGLIVKARTDKSKTPRPYRECVFSLYFDYGIDNIGSNLDYLYDLRGDDGKLKKNAEAIIWGGKEATLAEVVKFLKAEESYEEAQIAKKAETGNKALEIEWLKKWLSNSENKLYNKFRETFSQEKPKSRDELIQMIEEDSDLRFELEKRVIAKWEAEEAKVATNRKPKYG